MFESLSRTVTCTGELLALACVIPRGKDLVPPVQIIISGAVHLELVVQVIHVIPKYLICWTLMMNDI